MTVQLASRITEVAQEIQAEVWSYWKSGETRIEATLVVDTVHDFAVRVGCATDELPETIQLLLRTAIKVVDLSEEGESMKLSELIWPLNMIIHPSEPSAA